MVVKDKSYFDVNHSSDDVYNVVKEVPLVTSVDFCE